MVASHDVLLWLRSTDNFRIARAVRQDDRTPVLLKVLDSESATPVRTARLRREYELLRSLNFPGVAKALGFVHGPGALAIVLQDLPGEPLSIYLKKHQPSAAQCLRIATSLARTLTALHAQHIIHCDLQPENIFVSPSSEEVCIADFGNAVHADHALLWASDVGGLDLHAAYLSPEQTGCLNRPIDSRTDLYSLGVLLYRMLTGHLPFEAADLLEWVHCHVARTPRSLLDLSPGISPVVSALTLKLLATAPEDRYQSAAGLLFDLEQCLDEITRGVEPSLITLGSHDTETRELASPTVAPAPSPTNESNQQVEHLDELAINKATQAISARLSQDALLETSVRIILERAGAQSGALLLVRGQSLLLAAEAMVEQQQIRVTMRREAEIPRDYLPVTLINKARLSKETVLLADAAAMPGFQRDEYLASRRPKSVLCIPVLRANEVVGLLYLENNLATDVFSPRHLSVLKLLLTQAVSWLDNARLNAALLEDEERFRYIALAVRDAIYDWDIRSGSVWRNEAFRMFYLPDTQAGEQVGEYSTWWEQHLHPDDHQRIVRGVSRVFEEQGQLWLEEYRLRRTDGTYATVIDHGYILYDHAGEPVRMIGAITDITERKEAEEALHETEERMRRLMESNIIGIFFWSLEGPVTEANEAFLQLVGYSREDILARRINWTQMTPPEYAAATANAVAEMRSTGRCTPYEKEYFRKDGTRVPILVGSTLLDPTSDKGVSFVLDLTERRRVEGRVRYMAHHDTLTGLPNRVLLRDRVSQAIAQAHRNQRMVAMLFIDLDHFKDINDSLGHQTGDHLLRAVALRLHRCVRDGDSVARLGGDEFVISLPVLADENDAARVAEKTLSALNRPFIVDNNELHVSGSIGISLFPTDGRDPDALMRAADVAMYHAKESGRNNYQFFTPSLNQAARSRLEMGNRLHQALERDEFVLYYQPQVDLSSCSVVAAEALTRWRKPGAEIVSCGEFLKVAEDTGLISSIGEWALRQACRQVKQWRSAGNPDLRVAVNLSARQFRQPHFFELVAKVLADSGLPGNALELEITESVLMLQDTDTVLTLEKLFVLGVQLSVDDFGVGYSSLSYLQRFPIHALKIDRSFVEGIGRDPNDTAIVNACIAIAKSLHLRVVAEGVETEEQLAFLRERGCTAVQGYYFSQAVPPERLLDVVLTNGFQRHCAQ